MSCSEAREKRLQSCCLLAAVGECEHGALLREGEVVGQPKDWEE